MSIPIGTILLMKITYTLIKEDNLMCYQYKLGVFLLMVSGLFSCGGGEDSQQANPASPPENNTPVAQVENSTPILLPQEELTIDDIVAQPSATFKTSNVVTYSALNETNFNITLFITNNDGGELARYYIKAGEFTNISLQLDLAATEISMRWHYLEQVKKEHILIAELSHINFTGF